MKQLLHISKTVTAYQRYSAYAGSVRKNVSNKYKKNIVVVALFIPLKYNIIITCMF
jgi:hypothetical protein